MKKVFITDLRYDYNGALSSDVMPLGIGYMKAFMIANLDDVQVDLFAYPTHLENFLEEELPDILMMSNYMWNQKLNIHFAKEIKERNPKVMIVFGGPNFPLDDQKKEEFLFKYPFIDIYITGEGDFYATELVEAFINSNEDIEKFLSGDLHSCFFIHPKNGFISRPQKPRSRNLDKIPSPWLTGVMDQFFDGRLTPMIETNRGCPFSCTFCVQGQHWYTKVNYFSLDRVKEEIWYIGKKMNLSPILSLVIADSNFGMFERDIEISETIGEIQKMYHWPIVINATTGKNKPERIIQSIEKLNGAMVMYQAVQSLDEDVLENIKRKNISLEAYGKMQTYVRGRGLRSNSDVILGLPGETFEKHIYTLSSLINSGTNNLTSFQAILLDGTEMNTLESKSKYGIISKYRLIPKSYGKYFEKMVFEVEQIIVASNTFTFEEYLKARKLHFIINCIWNTSKYDMIFKLLNNIGFNNWDLIEYIYQHLHESNNESFAKLLNDFIVETQNELFADYKTLSDYYSNDEKIELLNVSRIGDNLIYKYKSLSNLYLWSDLCDVLKEFVVCFLKERGKLIEETKEFLNELFEYLKFKYLSGTDEDELFAEYEYQSHYDFICWEEDGCKMNFNNYRNDHLINYQFVLEEHIKEKMLEHFKIYPYNLINFPLIIRRTRIAWLQKNVKVSVLQNSHFK